MLENLQIYKFFKDISEILLRRRKLNKSLKRKLSINPSRLKDYQGWLRKSKLSMNL